MHSEIRAATASNMDHHERHQRGISDYLSNENRGASFQSSQNYMQVENRNSNKSAGNAAPSAPKNERKELKD